MELATATDAFRLKLIREVIEIDLFNISYLGCWNSSI
jgi:hypothetical protein